MISADIIIIGGGAAGMFAAAVLSEEAPELKVLVLEKSSKPLAKVRVSGGGRCNLTHACSDIREFVKNYPRGGRELIGPFNRFGPAEAMAWFEAHDVPLQTFEDGCVFPESDRSEDVVHVLCKNRAEIRVNVEVSKVWNFEGGFNVKLSNGEQLSCKRVLVATGGGGFIEGLDHTIEPCVPSLFTLTTSDKEFTALAGITSEAVRVSASGLEADGGLLITHSGVTGPAMLRLSSFGARTLAEQQYRFELKINWLPTQNEEQVFQTLEKHRSASPRKQVGTWSPVGLSSRLWKLLVARAGLDETREWGTCPLKDLRQIATQVSGFVLPIIGKNRHREEFVTCGGIRLKEIHFKTMESRRTPGLYFAGEVLDIDALTGGFNLQAAWTTGYLSAQAICNDGSQNHFQRPTSQT